MSRKSQAFNPIDIHVGRRMRERMKLMNVTHDQMAKAIEVTFQQIGKYVSGANRISASRLWHIANNLNVPVSYFFEGLPGSEITPASISETAIEVWNMLSKIDALAAEMLINFLRRLTAKPSQRRQAAE